LLRVATDEDYRQFQIELARNPEAGDIIPGLGGLRKIRMKLGSRGTGKRGGARVIYYWIRDDRIAFLIYLYTKGDTADVPEGLRKPLANLVKHFKDRYRRWKTE
jgi:hypothetical protein